MSVTVGEANTCIEAHLCLDSVLQCVAVNAEACDGEDFDMLQADSPQHTARSSPLKSHTSTSHVIDTQHSLHAMLTHAPQPTCASSLEHLHTSALQHTDTTVLQHTDIGASQHTDTAAVQHADTTALHHTGTAEPQHTGTPALPHTPLGGSREGRAGRGEVFGRSSQCEVALGPRVIGITEKGDPRQSDPEGYGIVARRRLDKGERFYDGLARYVSAGEPSENHKRGPNNDYYIKLAGGGGYFQIKQDGDGSFESNTYFLNEARNLKPNIRLDPRVSKDLKGRRLEWVVVHPIPKGHELVWEYDRTLQFS